MTKLNIALLLSACVFGSAYAQSSAQSPAKPASPQLTAATYKVVKVKEGDKLVEKLVSGAGAMPNDTLQFSYRIENPGSLPLPGLSINVPIPAQVTYLSHTCSAAGFKAQYSIDPHVYDTKTKAINMSLKKFGDAPLKKTVTVKENGADVKKEVSAAPADYTAVRLLLPDLAAGQNGECSVRVKVK